METTVISAVDPRDPLIAAQLYTLQQQAYTLEAELIGCSEFPPLRESIEELSRSTNSFIGFASDGQMVGALSFCVSADNVTITRLLVSPHHLRRGIATALITELEQRIPPTAQLHVFTAHVNVPAVSLYKRLGFRVCSMSISREGITLVHYIKNRSD